MRYFLYRYFFERKDEQKSNMHQILFTDKSLVSCMLFETLPERVLYPLLNDDQQVENP